MARKREDKFACLSWSLVGSLALLAACGRTSKFEDSQDDGSGATGTTIFPQQPSLPATDGGDGTGQATDGGDGGQNQSGSVDVNPLIRQCAFFQNGVSLAGNAEYQKFYRQQQAAGEATPIDAGQIYVILPTPFHINTTSGGLKGSFSSDKRFFDFTVSVGKPFDGNVNWQYPFVVAVQTGQGDSQSGSTIDNYQEHRYEGRVTLCETAGVCKLQMAVVYKGSASTGHALPAASLDACNTVQ